MKTLLLILIFLINKNLSSNVKERIELEEELSKIQLKVISGKMPDLIDGSFIKVGPARFTSKKNKIDHWFDGLGMYYLFKIENGNVFYTNKFINSDAYKTYKSRGEMNFKGFAYEKNKSTIKDIFSLLFVNKSNVVNNANVNLIKIDNEYVSLTEVPLPVKFDKDSLETKGIFEFEDSLPKNLNFECAHPLVDKKGEIYNFLIKFGMSSKYIIYKIEQKSRKPLVEIKVKKPSYMHSFSMTENYIILVEYPFKVNPMDLLILGKPFIKNFKWENSSTRFLIINKLTKEISEIEAEPFFSFHHANSYEKDGKILIDLIGYINSNIIEDLADFPNLKIKNSLTRFEIDLKDKKIKEEYLEKNIEFPVHFENAYYSVDFNNKNGLGISKFDLENRSSKRWFKDDSYASEPVVIKSKDNKNYVLSIVFDNSKSKSFLLILNENLDEEAILEIPHSIPFSLHGKFFGKD